MAGHSRSKNGVASARLCPAIHLFETMDTRVKPACDKLLLLRFPFFGRPAGLAPGGKATGDMRHRFQAHVLRGLGGERRTHATGAMKDEFLVLLEHRLGVGALRVDP